MKQILHYTLFLILGFIHFNSNGQTLTTLHNFDGTDGAYARGNQLVSDGSYFYGMTSFGGNQNKGTIFKINIDGTDFQKLHDFNVENGAEPYNSLTIVGTTLYGMTLEGGTNNRGVLFRINKDGSNYTKIQDFTGTDGDLPNSSLTSDGNYLYGSTFSAGIAGGGCIFRLNVDGTGYEIIHNFNGSDANNGTQPHFDFVWDDINGYLYGVTFLGGIHNKGIIYKIKTDGSGFIKLHDFDGLNGDYSGKLMLLQGELYATTLRGGANKKGIIYKIKTDGTGFTKLHDFDQTAGSESISALTFTDNYLYGTAINGGPLGGGIIFKIRTDGTEFTNVYNFNNDSGYNPWGGLYFDATDFYGINEGGGTEGFGTVYKFDPDGVLSVDDNSASAQLSVFPNPVKDKLNVIVKNPINDQVLIYDTSGKMVMKHPNNGNSNLRLDISHLNKGVYILHFGGKSVKFIKE